MRGTLLLVVLCAVPVVPGCSGSQGDSSTSDSTDSTTAKGWVNWTTGKALDFKSYLKNTYNKLMDEQSVDLSHTKPRKVAPEKYVVDVEIVIKGTRSGVFKKTYTNIECDSHGELTDAGNKYLKEKVHKHKKEIQDLQWE